MARLSVVLAVILLLGLVILGVVESAFDLPGSSLAGASVAEGPSQREINLCMNECMRGCVVEIDDNEPCRTQCDGACGVTHPE